MGFVFKCCFSFFPPALVNLSLCQMSSTTDQRRVMAPLSDNSSSFETWLRAVLEKTLCFLSKRGNQGLISSPHFPTIDKC